MKTKAIFRLPALLLLLANLTVFAQNPGAPGGNPHPNPQTCHVNLGPDKVICTGKTVTLLAGNFQSYLWSDGSTAPNLAVSTSGTYSVVVTGQAGCTATDTVTITVDNNALRVDAEDEFLTCAEPCDELKVNIGNGTPPFTIAWSNGETTPRINVCDSVSTVYTVTVTDTFGCTNTDTATVSYSDSICGVDHVLVCTSDFHGPHTQCVHVSDLNFLLAHGATVGCCAPQPVTCHINLGPDRRLCPGGSVTLDAGPGWASYLWANGETTQTITTSLTGTGWVTVTDSTGCSATDTITVSPDTTFEVRLGHDRYINCAANCVFLNASVSRGTPPFIYVWSSGDSVKRVQACDSLDATYSVTVSDAAGCIGSDTVNVIVSDSLCGDGRVLVCRTFGTRSITLCIDTADLQSYLDDGATLGCCDSNSIVHPFPHPPHGGPHAPHPHAGPNPFHKQTTIEYTVEESDVVTVEVYNAAGMKVSGLFTGKVEGNKTYRVDFNAGSLPPGVYIYQITTQSGEVYRDKLFLLE